MRLLTLLFLLLPAVAQAEIVFITDHLSVADEVVYVTKHGGEPVWKAPRASAAKNDDCAWFVTKHWSQATLVVYITKHRSEADRVIRFVPRRSAACH